MAYDYVETSQEHGSDTLPASSIADGAHYEFATEVEGPYWEPASKEDELKSQLQQLGLIEVSQQNLQ